MDAVNEIVQPARRPSVSLWRTAVVLFKLRIVSLLLLSAFGGAGLGTMIAGRASAWDWVLLAITGTFSAAGASGINQYLERERDAKMNRTAARPLATGQIENPHLVLLLGVGMVLGATALAAAFNLALAFWVFFGAVIYVGVYTVWLKPRTTLNIVIGGGAGAIPVLVGWAAATGTLAPQAFILFAIVFYWTPPHSWASR